MFEPQAAWWEFVLRAVIVYGVLLVLVRVSGRRTVGQFTPFDLLVVMLLSESVSNALNGGDKSVPAGLLGATTLVALNLLAAWLSARFRAVETALEGRPVLVGRDGDIFADVLQRLRVPLSDVEQSLRQADCDQADMRYAFLEADGQISILKASRMPAGGADGQHDTAHAPRHAGKRRARAQPAQDVDKRPS